MKNLNKFLFGLVIFSFLNVVFASNSPIPALEKTANQIIVQLKSNQARLKSNPHISFNIVTKNLLPLVDQQAMAQAVLGRSAWNSANAQQRSAFIAQFRTLVVRTYAAAFSEFTNEQVKFQPIRGGISGQVIQVKSIISSATRPAISVNYNLARKGSSWKIIDFSVDGVSMVQSFNSQFASQLAQSGINGLTQNLSQHNQKN